MSGFKVLDAVKPFAALAPEIELPYERVVFDEKIVYTIGVAAVYLLSSIPISGVNPTKIADPFYWMRLPFASEAGTLLEFGVLPVLTSALLWQILSGLKIIKVNFNSIVDRQTFQSLQKITSVVIAVLYATILALAGYFTPVDAFAKQELNSAVASAASSASSSAFWANLLIVTQLAISTGIVTLMVEMLEKGYGFGPGIMAFIAVCSATKFSGSLVGPLTNSKTHESNGVVIQVFRNFLNKPFTSAVTSIFTRTDEVNLTQVYLVIASVLAISYLQNFRMDVTIKSSKVRSMVSNYPIRLFYCGALPILFTYAILYNLNIVVFAFSKIFGGSPYLASWEINPFTYQTYDLKSGLLYFISASPNGCCYIFSSIRAIVFTLFVIISCAIFGRYWYAMSGSSGKDLAKQFKEQDIVVVGHRDATVAKELNKMIASASLIGAVILGAVVGITEATGLARGLVAGITSGLLCSMSLLEQVMTEYQQSGSVNSQFAQVFGN